MPLGFIILILMGCAAIAAPFLLMASVIDVDQKKRREVCRSGSSFVE